MVHLLADRALSLSADLLGLGRKASDRAKLWFLAAWGVTLLLPYYHQFVASYLWGTCSWNAFGMFYAFAGFNGYLLLGHYLRKLDWSLSKTLAIGIPMFVVGYAITFFGFRYISSLPEYTDEMYELFSLIAPSTW